MNPIIFGQNYANSLALITGWHLSPMAEAEKLKYLKLHQPIAIPSQEPFWASDSSNETTSLRPVSESGNEYLKRSRGGQIQHDWPYLFSELDGFIAAGGSIKEFCNKYQVSPRSLRHARKKLKCSE